MSGQAQPGDIQREWSKELFAVQRAIRYHTRRQAFYDAWNNVTNAAGILLGAATVAALAHKLPLGGVLSVAFPVAITTLCTFNLVWGAARRARLHNDLYRRYVELDRRMLSVAAPDAQHCRAFRGERMAIEADEPPTLFVLSVLCHNEVVRASGVGEYFAVPLWQRWLAHLWAFPDATFAPARRSAG